MWNLGWMRHSRRAVGSSSSYVEVSGQAFMAFHGPTNLGQSFLALPFSRLRFFMDRYMSVPSTMSGSLFLQAFVRLIWKTHASMMASCASARFCRASSVNDLIPLSMASSEWISFIMEGMYPPFNSNGANFVVSAMLALITNSVRSTWSTQSF